MAELEIFLYSSCTSCRKAEELLREKEIAAKRRDYFKDRFTKSELIGFAKLGPPALPVETLRSWVELRQIYIDPNWVGRGFARPLLDWATAEARRRGADELYLTVFVDNDRAIALYRRYGFVEVGPYAFMVGTHADEDVIMRLAL